MKAYISPELSYSSIELSSDLLQASSVEAPETDPTTTPAVFYNGIEQTVGTNDIAAF